MDLLSLKYFIAVSEFESFSKAADYLYTTQPNVSKHIQRLERDLDIKLFERNGPKIQLTYAGAKCLNEVKEIVERTELLRANATHYKSGEYGELRIGYTGEFRHSEFINILENFTNVHKNINIILDKGTQSTVIDNLVQKEVDVILTLATGLDKNDNIKYKEIMDNSLKIIFLDNHELKSSKFIKSEQLRNEPIIMFKQEASPFIYDVLIKYLRTNGLYNNIVSYENDLQSMILKVEAGKGITFTTELSLGSFTKNINLVDFDYDRANVKTDLVLAWWKDYENPSLSLFLDDIVYA